MYKKRILFLGEASHLSTGFSTYYRELLPRLVATGKFDIAEIGSYSRQHEPGVIDFIQGRWKFYGTMPSCCNAHGQCNHPEGMAFRQPSHHPRDKGQNINQFGAGVFDAAVADFKPDIVVLIRDNWMDTWVLRSSFRPWTKILWMPTVDAEPQQEEWVQDYEQADMILSYSDYGINALKRQSPLMRVFPTAMRPGVDIDVFKPGNHNDVRSKFMLNPDIPIVGTVARNQSRKLYPDLIDAFAHMKNLFADQDEAVRKAVLLIHSSWPDNQFSYDYPRHITRLHLYPWMPYARKGIKDDVLQTLICHNPDCGKISLGHAQMLYGKPVEGGVIRQYCKFCNKMTATCPTSGGRSFTREQLADVYNLMDLYVQCSICVHPDTIVKTRGESKKISDIKIGDDVWTHLGEYQSVTKIMTNKPNAPVVSLKVWGDNTPLVVTANHPVLTKDGSWKPVSELTTNDWLVYKFDTSEKDVPPTSLLSDDVILHDDGKIAHLTPRYYRRGKTLNLNKSEFEWNAENTYMAGLYVAEGSSGRSAVTFDSHEDELDIHERTRRFAKSFGITPYEEKRAEHGYRIILSCLPFVRLFKGHFGERAKVKSIPSFLMTAPLYTQASLLRGMFDGDGHYAFNLDRYYTSSPVLAYQVRDLLLRFGIASSIIKNRRDQFYVTVKEGLSRVLFSKKIRMVDKDIPDKPPRDIFISLDRENNIFYLRVKSISNSDYAGPVYNIEVENKKGGSSSPDAHSYMLSSFAVHNCEGDG